MIIENNNLIYQQLKRSMRTEPNTTIVPFKIFQVKRRKPKTLFSW